MKRQISTTALLVMLASQAYSASLTDLAFLSGCWSIEDNGVTTIENWTKSSENLVQGISHTKSSDGTVISYEFLRIEQRGNGEIVYTPYPNGQQANDFVLTTLPKTDPTKHTITFVNEKNEFPKRISYSQEMGDSASIFIHLEGTGENGQLQTIEFPMFKTDCNQVF